jgi:hypothetical protein
MNAFGDVVENCGFVIWAFEDFHLPGIINRKEIGL